MRHPLTPFMLADNLVDHLLTAPRVVLDALASSVSRTIFVLGNPDR